MKKIVINKCFGGFSISPEIAIELFKIENKVDKVHIYCELDEDECNPIINGYRRIDNFEFDEFGDFNNADVNRWSAYITICDLGELVKYKDLENNNSKYLLTAQQDVDREDFNLINMIEKLGSNRCSGECAKLKIIEIPKEVEYEIQDYDGNEWIAEKHRTWE